MISEATPYTKFKGKQIYFILREVTSHIVGYPTGPILQATGNHLMTLPPTILAGQQVLPLESRPNALPREVSSSRPTVTLTLSQYFFHPKNYDIHHQLF